MSLLKGENVSIYMRGVAAMCLYVYLPPLRLSNCIALPVTDNKRGGGLEILDEGNQWNIKAPPQLVPDDSKQLHTI